MWVTTNPPGAKATLDDDLAQSCQTPCMLRGSTGVHRLTVSQAGYENESREVRIGDTAMDVPSISLRRPSGTLMLSTDPVSYTHLVMVEGPDQQQIEKWAERIASAIRSELG